MLVFWYQQQQGYRPIFMVPTPGTNTNTNTNNNKG